MLSFPVHHISNQEALVLITHSTSNDAPSLLFRILLVSLLLPFKFLLISFDFMVCFTEHLQILYLTKHTVDVDIPANKPLLRVYNGQYVIDLYIGSNKELFAFCTPVMHCQLTSLRVHLPAHKGFFQSFVLHRPAP